MNKIPYKVRVGLSVGLFIYSICALLVSIVLAVNGYGLWIAFVGPILAITAFVFSIILMPKQKQESEPVVNNNKVKSTKKHKKSKKPFITDKEMEELDEEEEELDYIDD